MEWPINDWVLTAWEWATRNGDAIGVAIIGTGAITFVGFIWAVLVILTRAIIRLVRWVVRAPVPKQPATPKQIAYLIWLGVPPDEAVRMTKTQASARIKEIIDQRKRAAAKPTKPTPPDSKR